MRPQFADRLRCPRCRSARPFRLEASESDEREVRSGSLTCEHCGLVVDIRHGIVDLLHEPPEFVVAEAEGLGRFAQLMRDEGWSREDVLALPDREDGYWYAQAVLMQQTLETVPFEAGQTILDLGSNTCWASAMLAGHGLEVTALDISEHEMQGLRTADWQFEDKVVFFERVLAVMFDMPFADDSFDYIWACEVLHHNHRENLARTYAEAYRVLRPGGQLIVCNEPLRALLTPRLNPGHEVASFAGHEHAYMRQSYTGLARRAGFEVDVRGPYYHRLFRPREVTLSHSMTVPQMLRASAGALARRCEPVKRVELAVRAYLRGDTALHMICTKPG